jgi:CheY-like chemotaxis protein
VIRVLVVEDGHEYLTNLSTFVAEGCEYRQAQSGGQACRMARELAPDVVYLDMRFDRTPVEDLLGDVVQLTGRFNGDVARARRFQEEGRFNGDVARARRFQEDNQGLFVLRALRESGYLRPVILSYDFSTEERRFATLSAKDPALLYCPDYADAKEIREAIVRAAAM